MNWFDKSRFTGHTPYYGCIALFYIVLTLCSLHIPFFWDNVYLVSKMAHYYYENSFPSVVLPLQLDSGHPPFYAIYIAAMWTFFGKTLAVSHWAVFPFLVGLGIAYYHLARYFLPSKALPYALLLLFAEPTLLAQSVLGGVDIALVCLYLLALNGIFYRKPWLLSLALCGMAAFSLRGIIAVGLLGMTDFLARMVDSKEWEEARKRNLGEKTIWIEVFILHLISVVRQIILAYLPAMVLVVGWLVYHYQVNGFLTSNPDSPWANGYGYVDFNGWRRNLMFTAWRLLDYGRVILWFFAAILLLQYWQKRKTPTLKTDAFPSNFNSLFIFTILPLILYLPFLTLRQTHILHRYFIPTFLLVSVLFSAVLFVIQSKKLRNLIFIAAVLSLLSGHFWIYPERFPAGSDASLLFLPYFELSDQMTAYIEAQQIPFEEIGTEFPAVRPRKFTRLNNDRRQFADRDSRSQLTDFKYILESNIMNDFDIKYLEILRKEGGDWQLKQEYRKGQVYIRLYERY
ncbi:MAG: hypothetical protein R3E32_05095 [Chitinophagales bacterium]